MTTCTSDTGSKTNQDSSGEREARGRQTLGLLTLVWLFGGVDLCLSVIAARCGLLDADSECNPLAALMLSFGLWALLFYKILLSAGGSAILVVYRHRRIVRQAAAGLSLMYALVALTWALFSGVCMPFREVSISFGGFCTAVSQMGSAILALSIGCLVVAVAFRRGPRGSGFGPCSLTGDRADRMATARAPESRGPWMFRARGFMVLVLGLLLIPLSCFPARSLPARAAKQHGGTIFVREAWTGEGRLWRMNADGSDKTQLPVGVRGEPSRRTHAGRRWFLTTREVAGQTYPDGRPRRELIAVCEDGIVVQLADSPELEPAPSSLRWPMHANDRLISWIARRWGPAGEIVDGGIYAATIVFYADGSLAGLEAQPSAPLVRRCVERIDRNNTWWDGSPVPDVHSHDWSPDGTSIVLETTHTELLIVEPATGRASRITDTPGRDPVWSPDGSRIAFRVAQPGRGITTIPFAQAGATTTVEYHLGERVGVSTPIWSPDGKRLLYRRLSFPNPVESPADVDVWQVSAGGFASTNLTSDITAFLVPVAWRE